MTFLSVKNFFLTFYFITIFQSLACAQAVQTRGLRVDPAYFYSEFQSGTPVGTIASQVVSIAKSAGYNSLFVFVYSPVYGAFYKTTYPMVPVEGGFGVANITQALITAAKAQGVKVIAGFPVNNFKSVWDVNPTWRSKTKAGGDYLPMVNVYPLSAWHSSYRAWYRGLIKNFLQLHPQVDGVESVEGQVDYFWNSGADYNSVANNLFTAAFPGSTLGSANWKKHRALGMTGLHGILAEEGHLVGKKAYVVQTWSVNSSGQLLSSASISDGSGFDFDGVINQTGSAKPDFLVAEFMWQQWLAEFGTNVFTPAWTKSAAQQLAAKTAGRITPILHVEISSFAGAKKNVSVTDSEFIATIGAYFGTGMGIDIYDFHQLYTRGLLNYDFFGL